MRLASLLSAVTASVALVAAPALAQSADNKAPSSKPAASTSSAAKPAAKAGTGTEKATKVDATAAVRAAPADMTKGSAKGDYDGCGHGKMAASDL